MSRTTALLPVLALIAATNAHGAITGTTGMVMQIAPPPSATFGSIVGSPASAWDEQQGFVAAGLPVNLSINPSNSGSPTIGAVTGLVDSHIIHWNDFSGISIAGSVTFNNPIVGVAYTDNFLDVSDVPAGAFGTIYPTLVPNRGINSIPNSNSFVSILGNTISFNLDLVPGLVDFDQIRVFTAVPTPGSLALLGVGGMLAARRRRA